MAGSIAFSGMASGLDTDSIVEAMVSTYQTRVDNSSRQEILLEWKQEIYKDVSSKVYNFYTGTINKLRLESTFNNKLLTSSNTSAIKLDKTSTAPSGTHTLSDLKMATSAQIQTYKMTSGSGSVTSTTTMSDLGVETGKSITISDGIGDGKKSTTISFVDTVPENKEPNTIYLTSTDKISDLQAALKSAMPSASVNFDSNAGAFFISSTATGKGQSFEISGDTKILKSMGLTSVEEKNSSSVTHKDGNTTIQVTGTDAQYTYNGIEMTSESNNVSINGLKFTITTNTSEIITISSSTDTDGMIDTIKSFVEEYNTLIKELNDLIDADSAGSYEPLLDDEKEGMTDSQIDKWEKKIKDSLLRNDSTLKALTSSMRNALSGTLNSNGTYKSLSSIGITTSSDWTANGKLELDEDKLRQALSDKPDEIVALFTANGDNTNSSTKGLGDRLYETLGNNFKRIANVKSITSLFNDTLLTKERTNQSEKTDEYEERLETMKKMYYARFTAMETALSKLNSQTDSLTSLLSS